MFSKPELESERGQAITIYANAVIHAFRFLESLTFTTFPPPLPGVVHGQRVLHVHHCRRYRCVDSGCAYRECVCRECAYEECVRRECAYRECANRECAYREYANRECAYRECAYRECAKRERAYREHGMRTPPWTPCSTSAGGDGGSDWDCFDTLFLNSAFNFPTEKLQEFLVANNL